MCGRDLKLAAFALVFRTASIAWAHVHPMTSLEVAVGLGLQAFTGLVVLFAFALVGWGGPRWILLGVSIWAIGWALDAAVQIPLAAELLELAAPSAALDVGLAPVLCYAIGGAIVATGAMARAGASRRPMIVICAIAFVVCATATVIADDRLAIAILRGAGPIGATRFVRDVLAGASLLSLAGVFWMALSRTDEAKLPSMRLV